MEKSLEEADEFIQNARRDRKVISQQREIDQISREHHRKMKEIKSRNEVRLSDVKSAYKTNIQKIQDSQEGIYNNVKKNYKRAEMQSHLRQKQNFAKAKIEELKSDVSVEKLFEDQKMLMKDRLKNNLEKKLSSVLDPIRNSPILRGKYKSMMDLATNLMKNASNFEDTRDVESFGKLVLDLSMDLAKVKMESSSEKTTIDTILEVKRQVDEILALVDEARAEAEKYESEYDRIASYVDTFIGSEKTS